MDNPARSELVERLVELMGRMSGRLRSRPPAEWPELELTMPQAKALFSLSEGPARMSSLSEFLGRGMSSATSMIDRLVKKGLVERLEDASDRRVVECRLTSQGREAVEAFWRIRRMRREEIAGLLTLGELELVVPAIEVLTEAMARQGRAPVAEQGTERPESGAAEPDSVSAKTKGTPAHSR